MLILAQRFGIALDFALQRLQPNAGIGTLRRHGLDAEHQFAQCGALLLHLLLALGLHVQHGQIGQIRVDAGQLPASECHVIERAAAVGLERFVDGRPALSHKLRIERAHIKAHHQIVLPGDFLAGHLIRHRPGADHAAHLNGAHELLIERQNTQHHLAGLREKSVHDPLALQVDLRRWQFGMHTAGHVGGIAADAGLHFEAAAIHRRHAHEVGVVALGGRDLGAGLHIPLALIARQAARIHASRRQRGQAGAIHAAVPQMLHFPLRWAQHLRQSAGLPQAARLPLAAEIDKAAAFVPVVQQPVQPENVPAVLALEVRAQNQLLRARNAFLVHDADKHMKALVALAIALQPALQILAGAAIRHAVHLAAQIALQNGGVEHGRRPGIQHGLDELAAPAFVHLGPQIRLAQPHHHGHPWRICHRIAPAGIKHVNARSQRFHRRAARLGHRQAKLRHALGADVLHDLLGPLFGDGREAAHDQALDLPRTSAAFQRIQHRGQAHLLNQHGLLLIHRLASHRLHLHQPFLRHHLRQLLLTQGLAPRRPFLFPAHVHDGMAEALLPLREEIQLAPQLGPEALLQLVIDQRLHPARGVHVPRLHRHHAQIRAEHAHHAQAGQFIGGRIDQPHPRVAGPVPWKHALAVILLPLLGVVALPVPDRQQVLLIGASRGQPGAQIARFALQFLHQFLSVQGWLAAAGR